MNHSTLFGRLGKDPELKTLPSGATICTFSVADDWRYQKGEEWIDRVQWVSVAIFGKRGEAAARALQKGQAVALFGRFEISQWKDKNGNPRETLTFQVESWQAGAVK
jgi:single-strand DNA-binding protein